MKSVNVFGGKKLKQQNYETTNNRTSNKNTIK